MTNLAEKIRDTFAPSIDDRMADIETKLAAARAELGRAREAHAHASFNAQAPDAAKNAASALTTTHRNLEAALTVVSDLEAALTAAEAAKQREATARVSAEALAKRVTAEAAYAVAHKAASEMSQALDVLVAKSIPFADAMADLQAKALPGANVGSDFQDFRLMFEQVLGYRLKHMGLRHRSLIDVKRLEDLMSFFPSAEQVLNPRKRA